MQSFLIIAKDKNTASSYTSELLKEREVHPLDVNLQSYEKMMGISDVRNIQKAILLKPFRGKTKAVVIEAYENITTEAQNSLLKILEEPPANTIIIISVSTKELLLPTIHSRCKIIELREEETPATNDESAKFNNVLDIIFDGNIGAKLKIAQDIAKDTKEVGAWLKKMVIFTRTKSIENYNNPKYLHLLKQLQKAHAVVSSTNVGKRVTLETLFLSF